MPKKYRIVHLIPTTNTGGAEIMLYQLTRSMDKTLFENIVVSLSNKGIIGKRIEEAGIEVCNIGMSTKGNPLDIWQVLRLFTTVKSLKPDLLYCWMAHTNILGILFSHLLKVPVIWSIHGTATSYPEMDRLTYVITILCAKMSTYPDLIVCCSETVKKVHINFGFNSDKMVVIENGVDLSEFKRDEKEREALRAELGVSNNDFLIGFIGRFDRVKDHLNLIKAAKMIVHQHRNVYFIMCGDGIDLTNKKLTGWIEAENIMDHFFLLGWRPDISKIMASIDVNVLPSFSEGFPIVICEAMAGETPCIVTDTGEMPFIVGDTGIVIPQRDSPALANAIEQILMMSDNERIAMGKKARDRIAVNFSLQGVVRKYEKAYLNVMEKH